MYNKKMSKRNFVRKFVRSIKNDSFKFVLTIVLFTYAICLIVITIVRRANLYSAFTYLLPSFFGQLTDIEINSGEIVRLIALASYILFLGAIVSKISEHFIDRIMIGGTIMNKTNFRDHIIICGWNYQAPEIIKHLTSKDLKYQREILILADFEKIPYKSTDVNFLKGVPWRREDLIKAGVLNAAVAIILPNSKSSNPDADSLLTVLAAESLNKSLYTCVLLYSLENKQHLEEAGADEIICLDELGSSILVSSAINHGLSKVVSNMVSYGTGSEIYKYNRPVPDEFVGKDFREIVQRLIEKNIIVIAIETMKDEHINEKNIKPYSTLKSGHIVIVNPTSDYKIRKDDNLYILAEKEPLTLL